MPGRSLVFLQRIAAVALALLVAGACASGGGSRASVSGSTVTAADLENVPFDNAYEVLESHNSVEIRGGTLYLRGRVASINDPTPALLVLDGTRMGGESAGVLQGIQVGSIARIEILRAAEATNRFGTQGGGGAVVIQTQRD